jgi:hypothetical protein
VLLIPHGGNGGAGNSWSDWVLLPLLFHYALIPIDCSVNVHAREIDVKSGS